MKKLLVFAGAVAILVGLWLFGAAPHDTAAPASPVSVPATVSSASPLPAPAQMPASMSLAAASSRAGSATQGAVGEPAPSANLPEWIRHPPDLGLTRTLSGDQAVFYDGRPRKVLGTKESQATGSPAQAVLLVRDESSGQIDYFQSGLQFRLQPGTDAAAFLRERPQMKSLFSNPDYTTVLVDAGSIANEYRTLKSDPRVTYVTFLKPQATATPK